MAPKIGFYFYTFVLFNLSNRSVVSPPFLSSLFAPSFHFSLFAPSCLFPLLLNSDVSNKVKLGSLSGGRRHGVNTTRACWTICSLFHWWLCSSSSVGQWGGDILCPPTVITLLGLGPAECLRLILTWFIQLESKHCPTLQRHMIQQLHNNRLKRREGLLKKIVKTHF